MGVAEPAEETIHSGELPQEQYSSSYRTRMQWGGDNGSFCSLLLREILVMVLSMEKWSITKYKYSDKMPT